MTLAPSLRRWPLLAALAVGASQPACSSIFGGCTETTSGGRVDWTPAPLTVRSATWSFEGDTWSTCSVTTSASFEEGATGTRDGLVHVAVACTGAAHDMSASFDMEDPRTVTADHTLHTHLDMHSPVAGPCFGSGLSLPIDLQVRLPDPPAGGPAPYPAMVSVSFRRVVIVSLDVRTGACGDLTLIAQLETTTADYRVIPPVTRKSCGD